MDSSQFWPRFILAALATWRICHLLASEDGPADVAARLRARMGDTPIGRLFDCFGCLSVWVAIPFAFFVSDGLVNRVITWLAISGLAFLLERMSPEPVLIERAAPSGSGDFQS